MSKNHLERAGAEDHKKYGDRIALEMLIEQYLHSIMVKKYLNLCLSSSGLAQDNSESMSDLKTFYRARKITLQIMCHLTEFMLKLNDFWRSIESFHLFVNFKRYITNENN